ncbi:disease resistance protein Pik-2-like [Miscanthus floridulus]|uniref:disease resistance protein Pik-2-like n=1 Tax=Miscanthus floridulus TaxID=154761 RepID=UPI00345A22D0
MELVTGAMGSLIPKLKDLLKEEYKLQTGVKDQVRSLKLELESAHAALHKVAKVRPDQLDELVKIWAREVQEASYDMEDILDYVWYFIIIDDIWEPQTWERIKLALVENNHGSRIITTTRKFQVAKEADEVYNLQPLSHDNSKRLFYIRLFGHEDKCPNNHPDELSNAILKKCGGVPLAIITMASLLLGKSREEWIEVCNSPGFYGDKDERHMDNTMHILSLSYYDLPSHLKTSVLYLIVFPEDTLIDKDSLIWKWISENFVEKKQGRWSFEVGEEYVHDLINRSMIQGVDSKVYGIMDGCRVHDMVLDLILSKSKEENFVSDGGTLSQS